MQRESCGTTGLNATQGKARDRRIRRDWAAGKLLLTASARLSALCRSPRLLRRLLASMVCLLGCSRVRGLPPGDSDPLAHSHFRRLFAASPAPGDLVLRRTTTLLGRAVQSVDTEATFSHVGVLVESDDGHLLVAHVSPDQPTAVLEAVTAFLDPAIVTSALVLRLRSGRSDAATGARAAAAALGFVATRVVFDYEFDIRSDDRMYCTELVWKAYRSAGVDLGEPTRLPLLKQPILLVSSIARSAQFGPIYSYRTEPRQ